jgi:hypothetical protein
MEVNGLSSHFKWSRKIILKFLFLKKIKTFSYEKQMNVSDEAVYLYSELEKEENIFFQIMENLIFYQLVYAKETYKYNKIFDQNKKNIDFFISNSSMFYNIQVKADLYSQYYSMYHTSINKIIDIKNRIGNLKINYRIIIPKHK